MAGWFVDVPVRRQESEAAGAGSGLGLRRPQPPPMVIVLRRLEVQRTRQSLEALPHGRSVARTESTCSAGLPPEAETATPGDSAHLLHSAHGDIDLSLH